MSWLNVGEVAYQIERCHGAEGAGLVTPDRVLAAAHIKAQHAIALADCFAAATAAARGVTLFTGDPGILGRDLGCEVRDLGP